MKKSGLGGKGLGAMIPKQALQPFTINPDNGTGYTELDINIIEPNPEQPRKHFPAEELEQLAASIKAHGIIQPIVVNKKADFVTSKDTGEEAYKYIIIAGERRWRAARQAGLTTLPCIVKSYDSMKALQIALIENIQRQDLNPIEEALCYQQLQEYFFNTKEEIADKVGKSRNTIAARINLLTLSDEVIEHIATGELSAGHGTKLVGLPLSRQTELAGIIIAKQLSVKETEALINQAPKPAEETPNRSRYNPYIAFETGLKERFGTKVNIKDKDGKGKIEIEYYSPDDLERILEIIK